jgi:hypothetical protein
MKVLVEIFKRKEKERKLFNKGLLRLKRKNYLS